ncbi:Maf family protein [Bacillus sp. 165]|uniref:Maf family protein n=1 Tax=Bacillus sp. 165 TaxID=1529117 RepID=UPI001ADBD014|nr:Maf family protein [Bacillus sp. 165]MBO9130509.1 septum formation inhibitor Maf [Bacillus sp. 165]
MQRLILASGSPRRKELLENLRLSFEVYVSEVEEIIDEHAPPHETVMSLALQKASDVGRRFPHDIVLGADTIVTYGTHVLGKPKNTEEAQAMLRMLSGQTHEVYTGVAIISPLQTITFFERTEVTFWELLEHEIQTYIESKEPFDKAGAYGIQGFGASLVKRIVGDYYSVVGLPVARTIRELRKFGF